MREDRLIAIELLNADNKVVDEIRFVAKDDGKRVSLSCLGGLLGEAEYTVVDYFWVFADMREDLAKQSLRPACEGALINNF